MQRQRPYNRKSFVDFFSSASPQQILARYKANNLYLPLLQIIHTFSSDNHQLAAKVIQIISLYKPQDSPALQLLIGVVHEKTGAPSKALEHYYQLFTLLPDFYSAYTYYCTLQFQRIAALKALPTLQRRELKDLYTSVKWVLEEMMHAWQVAHNKPKAINEPTKSVSAKQRKAVAEKALMAEANQFYAQALEGLNQLQALNCREVNVPNEAYKGFLLFAPKKEHEKSKACAPRPLCSNINQKTLSQSH